MSVEKDEMFRKFIFSCVWLPLRLFSFSPRYQGLAHLAFDVQFSPIRIPDIEDNLKSIAAQESIHCDTDHVFTILADYANGDVRKSIQAFEMLATSKNVISREDALSWVELNVDDTDEKYLFQHDAGAKGDQTDEDRILQSALTLRTDENGQKLMETARRLVNSNSVQFTPLIFQAYPNILPNSAISHAADMCDMFSLGDCIRENSFRTGNFGDEDDSLLEVNGGGHFTNAVSTFSVEIPLSILQRHQTQPPPLVKTDGYVRRRFLFSYSPLTSEQISEFLRCFQHCVQSGKTFAKD